VGQRDTLRYTVNRSPGEGPGHDRTGPCHRPSPRTTLWDGSCVLPFSRTRKVSFAPCGSGGMPLYTAGYGRFRFSLYDSCTLGRSYTDWVTSCQAVKVKQPATQPPGGSESGERSEPVFARSVGPDRATNDRDEGGPTGTTELVCGRSRGYRRGHQSAGFVAPVRPPNTGTCLLRRFAGSMALLTGQRTPDLSESGCGA